MTAADIYNILGGNVVSVMEKIINHIALIIFLLHMVGGLWDGKGKV